MNDGLAASGGGGGVEKSDRESGLRAGGEREDEGERNNARTIFRGKESFISGRKGRPRNSYPFFRIPFNLNNFDCM